MITKPTNQDKLKAIFNNGNTFIKVPKVLYSPDHLGLNKTWVIVSKGTDNNEQDWSIKYADVKTKIVSYMTQDFFFHKDSTNTQWFFFI
jgi:hypothetical protein